MSDTVQLTAETFSAAVFERFKDANARCETLMEACVELCAEHDLDEADAKRYIAEPLKVALQAEARRRNMMKARHKTKRIF